MLFANVAFRSISATPLSGFPDPIGVSQVTNLSAPEQVDLRFGVMVSWPGQSELDAVSGLMVIAKMLYCLSLCDWNGVVPARTYVDVDYPEVSISLGTSTGSQAISTKLAVWGILAVGDTIRSAERVRDFVFAITWDNRVVGRIEFRANSVQPNLATDGSTQNVTLGPNALSSSKRGLDHLRYSDTKQRNLTMPSSDPRIQRQMMVTERELTKWQYFGAVFWNLFIIAHYPSDQLLKTFEANVQGLGSLFTGWLAKDPRAILQYHEAALTMYTLPVSSMRQREGKFFETYVTMRVGRLQIGRGYILATPPGRRIPGLSALPTA